MKWQASRSIFDSTNKTLTKPKKMKTIKNSGDEKKSIMVFEKITKKELKEINGGTLMSGFFSKKGYGAY